MKHNKANHNYMRCACAPAKFLDKNGASEQLGLRRILKALPARPEPCTLGDLGGERPRDGSWRGCHRDCVGPPALSVCAHVSAHKKEAGRECQWAVQEGGSHAQREKVRRAWPGVGSRRRGVALTPGSPLWPRQGCQGASSRAAFLICKVTFLGGITLPQRHSEKIS